MNAELVVPRHVGIIMDGNGRWAQQQGLRRTRGHRAGVSAAQRVTLGAIDVGIEYLTLYAFSTENWSRTEEEVSYLMNLVARQLRSQYDFYRRNDIRVRHIGDIESLPTEVRDEIHEVTAATARNTAITVTLAVNYGGRDEIVRAVNRWARQTALHGDTSLTSEELETYLDEAELPDPDLIIRTGGELRISNFLLWGCAYAELYFSERLWPDWDAGDLEEAIRDFALRRRNFGAMPDTSSPDTHREIVRRVSQTA